MSQCTLSTIIIKIKYKIVKYQGSHKTLVCQGDPLIKLIKEVCISEITDIVLESIH
jgi:hypothetical protein